MEDIIVIVGPTGVGKTKLSIELAKHLNAEIINGDSVAIYKYLDIGSAKPTVEERSIVPHHLVDICNLEDNYSVYSYQQDVRGLIKDITSRGKRVIIVGGTGLYIKAALYNYKFTEGTTYNTYDDLTNSDLLEKLKNYNVKELPHINNRKRLIRLLNKLENGEEITNDKDEALYPLKVIGLTTSKEILYERINNRVDKMLADGLLEEVTNLRKYYATSRILNNAIGYKEFASYFNNTSTLEQTIEAIKQDSRRYAKRQYTFFKHQFETEWFQASFDNFDSTIAEVLKYLDK